MTKNLITILIVIAILVGVYYLISPYQNCYRNLIADVKATPDKSDTILKIPWKQNEEEKNGKTETEITADIKVYASQECGYVHGW